MNWKIAAHGQGLWKVLKEGRTEGRSHLGSSAQCRGMFCPGARANGVAECRFMANRESFSSVAPDQLKKEEKLASAEDGIGAERVPWKAGWLAFPSFL